MGGRTIESIYQHPLYYDILYGWDRDAEADFYDNTFQLHGTGKGSRLLEIGCGTGQVGIRLAKRGWKVSGLDIEPGMLEFMAEQASRNTVEVATICADMTAFTLERRYDGAYCPIGTLGHLPTDDLLLSHLQSAGNSLRPDGIYIVDMDFTGETNDKSDLSPCEDWGMARDGIVVVGKHGIVSVDDRTRGAQLTLDLGNAWRWYTGREFADVVERSGMFSIEAWHTQAGVSPEGIILFDIHQWRDRPVSDRAMVVLKRLGTNISNP